MINSKLINLIESGVHLGHKTKECNPKMFPYLLNEKNGRHIIDPLQTFYFLKKASSFLEKQASKGHEFLFIGSKRQAKNIVKKEAIKCNSFFVNSRWLGGTLTNLNTLQKRINFFNLLKEQEKNNLFESLSKKEISVKRKKLKQLTQSLVGIEKMKNLPNAVIIVDQFFEKTAIKECQLLNIPIISIVDSNCNPDIIDIPIPGNDDSEGSIEFIVEILSNSIIEGKKKLEIFK